MQNATIFWWQDARILRILASQYSIILTSKYYIARPFGPRFNNGDGKGQNNQTSMKFDCLFPFPLKDGTRRVPSNIIYTYYSKYILARTLRVLASGNFERFKHKFETFKVCLTFPIYEARPEGPSNRGSEGAEVNKYLYTIYLLSKYFNLLHPSRKYLLIRELRSLINK